MPKDHPYIIEEQKDFPNGFTSYLEKKTYRTRCCWRWRIVHNPTTDPKTREYLVENESDRTKEACLKRRDKELSFLITWIRFRIRSIAAAKFEETVLAMRQR